MNTSSGIIGTDRNNNDKENSPQNDKKFYGNLSNIRDFVINVTSFLGSYLILEIETIKPFYALQAVISSTLIFYCVLVFEEERKPKVFPGVFQVANKVKKVFRYVLHPSVILPFSYLWLNNMIPSGGSASAYLLMARGGWTLATFGFETIAFGVVYVMVLVYIVNYLRYIPLEWVFILYGATIAGDAMYNFLVLYCSEVNFYLLFLINFLNSLIGSAVSELALISLIGKFSMICPDGLESTGISILVALDSIFIMISGQFDILLISHYGIKAGYYDRLFDIFVLIALLTAGVVMISPLFSLVRAKGEKSIRAKEN